LPAAHVAGGEYAVLSLLNNGDDTVSARAGIEADFLPTIILE
jgi:hypothetical protein